MRGVAGPGGAVRQALRDEWRLVAGIVVLASALKHKIDFELLLVVPIGFGVRAAWLIWSGG